MGTHIASADFYGFTRRYRFTYQGGKLQFVCSGIFNIAIIVTHITTRVPSVFLFSIGRRILRNDRGYMHDTLIIRTFEGRQLGIIPTHYNEQINSDTRNIALLRIYATHTRAKV